MSGECNVCNQTGCVEFEHCAFKGEVLALPEPTEKEADALQLVRRFVYGKITGKYGPLTDNQAGLYGDFLTIFEYLDRVGIDCGWWQS